MLLDNSTPFRGRGAANNPTNRFELLCYTRDETCSVEEATSPQTQFYRDNSHSIISYNDSPDIPFEASVNPYRGCEHGCIYCYARPYHEYLGFSAGLDFETKIMVKEDAPELLRKELNAKKWQPRWLAMCGVTDAYQPIERKLQLSRRCLQVLAEFRNPVGIVTKNHLVTRDADLLAELAQHDAACVTVAITSLDSDLARVMEPRATHPLGRLEAIRELKAAGVPVGVMIAPVIPGLNDHEIPAILQAAAAAGAGHARYVMLRLPHQVKDLFETWLSQHFPGQKEKVLGRLRQVHEGQLISPEFGKRMKGQGVLADQIEQLFRLSRQKAGITSTWTGLSTAAFRRPGGTQKLLFE